MVCRSLGEFLKELEQAGQLGRVTAEVSSRHEIGEITRRVVTSHGPALVFDNVIDWSCSVVTNVFATEDRIRLALGTDDFDLVGRRLIGEAGPTSWLQRLTTGLQEATSEPYTPRVVKTAACQQVVKLGRDVNLEEFPAVGCGEHDGLSPLNGCMVVTSDYDGKQRFVGNADLVVRDRKRLGVSWAAHDVIADHYRSFALAGEKMSIAIVLGGPPAVVIASHAVLPAQVDGYAFAGLLGGAPVDVNTCRAIALQVPAEAEIVIEGQIDPAEPAAAIGPLPTASGRYGHRPHGYTIDVDVVTQRTDAVFPARVHTRPPNEARTIQSALARILLPSWRQVIPELVDYDYPAYAAEGFAVASLSKRFPHQARKVANALWGQDATMTSHMLVLVDHDVDIRDEREVWFRITANVDPQRDVIFQECPADEGFASREKLGRIALDATAKTCDDDRWPSAGDVVHSADVRERVTKRWAEFGLS